jgi:hypothetical protein
MVRLMQTMHLSCTDTNTISKWTKTRFHMTHATEEFHRVRLKRFLSLWYVRCKPCTYLVSRLALSPNGPNRASTLATSPRSTIGCVQNDFWANGTFGANRDPRHLGVLSSVSNTIFETVVSSAQTVHLSYVSISTFSKRTESTFHLSLVT